MKTCVSVKDLEELKDISPTCRIISSPMILTRKIEDIITTTRGFYAHYDIDLPKRMYHAPEPDLQNEAIPSKDDIKKALSFCNIKYQSIILLISSSGISLGDVLNLKFSDFLNALEVPHEEQEIDILNYMTLSSLYQKNNVPMWHIQRMKTGTSHITFNTPETTNTILCYLIEHPPKNIDDPLFRGKTDKKFRSDVFQRFLRKLNKQCGWEDVGRQIFFHSHILRKFFSNKLEESGMPIITYASSWDTGKIHLPGLTFPLPMKS
jgi:integrase